MEFETAKMGERGQIVVPNEFRKNMGLEKGDKFIVIEQGDTLLFKRLKAPSMKEFEMMLSKTHEHARKHGLTEKDLAEAIKKARS